MKGYFMYDNSVKLQVECAPGEGKTEQTHAFKILADEFEHAVICLHKDVSSLGSIFEPVLRPINSDICNEKCQGEGAQAPLESWLGTQLQIVKTCIDSIRDYKNRCIL